MSPQEDPPRQEVARKDEEEERPVEKSSLMEMAAAWFQSSGHFNPDIASKVSSEHITQMFRNDDAQNARVAQDRRESRRSFLILVGIGASFLLGLVGILVFSNNADLVRDIVQIVMSAGAGGLGGYGIGKRSR